ncbi:MAG: hypothetical protein HOM80_13880 [Bacteroidetes bacterium]|nr:hypothetical protein [Bacteroidota bacterium]
MNPILRNILSVIAGIVLGMLVNGGIISISGSIIPPPEGADATSIEGLKESIHLFQPKHFILPFLAHALGTFFGALLTGLLVINHKMKFVLGIGIIFLAAGIANVFILPAPMWFNVVDLVGAYIPFAFVAGLIIPKKK